MDTATKFFYWAAGQPEVVGAVNTSQWAALSVKRRPVTPPGGQCYLCGATIDDGVAVPTRDRIDNKTWTAHATAKAPSSGWICLACMASLDEAAIHPAHPDKPFKMRTMSHLIIGRTWTVLGLSDKRRMADVLLDPPRSDPWMLCIVDAPLSASHALYRTPINAPSDKRWGVMFGGALVQASAELLCTTLSVVEAQYNADHSKSAIRTGNYAPKWILAQGENAWVSLEARIALMRGTPLFDLALFLAQKGTDLE